MTSEYYKGRDPKLIAWTACNMVLKRRRDGSDSKARSESVDTVTEAVSLTKRSEYDVETAPVQFGPVSNDEYLILPASLPSNNLKDDG